VAGGVGAPGDAAGLCIQRDQAAVEGPDEDLVLPQRHAAVDRLAAALAQPVARDLGIVGPQPPAIGRVEGEDPAPGGGDVEPPVGDQRRGLDSEVVAVERSFPGEAELADVGRGDLVQRRIALLGVGAPGAQPVGAVALGHRETARGDPVAAR
jgi:hypothetical protein